MRIARRLAHDVSRAANQSARQRQNQPQRQPGPQRQTTPQAPRATAEDLTTGLLRLRGELVARQKSAAPAPAEDVAETPPPVVKNLDRPQSLDQVIGQAELKVQLETCLMGAMLRGERIPNILLQGSPGMGKTSIASLIAHTVGADFIATAGPMLNRPPDLIGIIVKATGPTVVFLDEAHACSKSCLEAVYSIMEDGKIDVITGSGADAMAYTQECPHIIIVAGTTRPGLLPEPFRARAMTFTMAEYSDEEISTIIERVWDRHETPYAAGEPMELARRCKSNPRRSVSLAQRVLDFTAVIGASAIHPGTVDQAMGVFRIEENGMDETDLKVIHALVKTFSGKPTGADALASYLNIDTRSLTDSIEPWLCREGYILRSRSGRLASPKAHELAKVIE